MRSAISDNASDRFKKIMLNNTYVLLFILVIVLTVGGILVPAMFQITNIVNVLRIVSYVGIVAIGMTAVLLTGEIDLSVGSIMSLSLVTGGIFLDYGSVPALLVTYLTGIIFGIINGIVVTKGKIKSLMVTLGTLSVYGGLANVVARGQAKYLYESPFYLLIGRGDILGIPIPVIIFTLGTLIFSFVLSYTKIGKEFYYTGANQLSAWLSGVKVDKIKIMAFAFSGLCAAIAGPLFSSQTNRVTPTQGLGFELSALAVAVLGGAALNGGKGSAAGTLLGALIFGFLLNILTLSGIGTYMEQILKGILLVVIVMLFQKINKRYAGSR